MILRHCWLRLRRHDFGPREYVGLLIWVRVCRRCHYVTEG